MHTVELTAGSTDDLRAILDGIAEPVVVFDDRDVLTFVSAAAAMNAGGVPADFVGKRLGDPPFGPLPELLEAAIARMRATGHVQRVVYPSRVMRADIHATVIPTASGFAISARDIRPHDNPSPVALLDDERLRFLVAETSDVLLLFDADARISYVSPSVQQVLGYAPQELVGRHVKEFVHPLDNGVAEVSFHRALATPGARGRAEFRVRAASGEWREISASGFNHIGIPPLSAFIAIWEDVTAQRIVDGVNATATERLRELVRRLDQVRAEEQARAARDIHDRLGQALTMARIGLQRLAERPEAADVRDALLEIRDDVDASINASREISGELRPPLLEEFGLAAALEAAATRTCQHAGLALELALDEVRLPRDEAYTLFRVAQEALTNVIRHAGARSVRVGLHAHAGGIRLSIRDDGVGFRPDRLADPLALGLLGMQERMAAIGGAVSIHGSTGAGTTITASLSLEAEDRP